MVLLRYRKVLENSEMIPSRNMVDYSGKAIQYFPTASMDRDTSNTFNSPFQTPIANRYSSSTDSTSPDSYFTTPFQLTQSLDHNIQRSDTPKTYVSHLSNFNASFNRNTPGSSQNYDGSNEWNFPRYDTQYDSQIDTPVRRQRAIVGRKILGSHSSMSKNERLQFETEESRARQTPWHSLESTQRQYDLFPSNETSFDFRMPVKKSTDYSPNYAPMSPTSSVATQPCWSQNLSPPSSKGTYADQLSNNSKRLQYTRNLSPVSANMFQYAENLSPMSNRLEFSGNLPGTWSNRVQNLENLSAPRVPEFKLYSPRKLSSQEIDQLTICTFCKKNGETPIVYTNHQIKEKIGNKYRVTCPILRALVCTICGVSGDDAHTITYCPELRKRNNGQPLKSTTITLKSTRTKSNGTKRY